MFTAPKRSLVQSNPENDNLKFCHLENLSGTEMLLECQSKQIFWPQKAEWRTTILVLDIQFFHICED